MADVEKPDAARLSRRAILKRRLGGSRAQALIGPADAFFRDLKTLDRYSAYSDGRYYYAVGAIRRIVERSPLLQSFIEKLCHNVAGDTGPEPHFELVENKRDRSALLELWESWRGCASVCGRFSWAQLIDAAVASRATDGRTFLLIQTHEDYPCATALLAVAREWLEDEHNAVETTIATANAGSRPILNGVSYKPSGAIEGYIFRNPTQQNIALFQSLYTYSSSFDPVFYPRSMVCDLMSPRKAGDVHGSVSHLIPAINTLSELIRLDRSMLASMEAHARKSGFLEQDLNAPQLSVAEQLELPTEFEDNHVEPLPPGYRFSGFDPNAPNAAMGEYRRELAKNAAAGLGMDYATLSGDLREVNYSSIRAGMVEARRFYRMLQRDVEQAVCGPVMRQLVQTAQLFGFIRLQNSRTIDQAARCNWRWPAVEWIDPLKDAMATGQQIAMGLTSPQLEAAKRGHDFNSLIAEFAAARDKLAEFGLMPADLAAFGGRVQGGAPAQQQGSDQPDDDRPDDKQ